MSKEAEHGGGGGKGEEEGGKTGEGWVDIDYDELEVGRKIGGGGFAVVYEGRWKGQKVALKTMFDPKVDERTKAEYMDELHCMRHLDHANIVKFLGAVVVPPKQCIVMELCNYSLFHLLHDTRTPLKEEVLIKLAVDTASAMAYLHAQKPMIIHRDLKSHNLLVVEHRGTYTLKLCDFGLVSTRVTAAGTPNYMAPELLKSKPFSRKCDVYAFAMVLWELFQREIPFDGWLPADISDAVIKGERPPMMGRLDAPEIVRSLIQRCWAADPAGRPEFEEIERDLRAWKPKVSAVKAVRGGGDSLDALLGM